MVSCVAPDSDPSRLVMAGQNAAGQIIKAALALLAPVALPMPLRVIVPVAPPRRCNSATADILGPSMLTHHLVAFCIINQRREVHPFREAGS